MRLPLFRPFTCISAFFGKTLGFGEKNLQIFTKRQFFSNIGFIHVRRTSVGVIMTVINSINNNQNVSQVGVAETHSKPAFRAYGAIPADSGVDSFIKAQEAEKKKAKKQQNLNTGIQIGVLGVLGLSVGLMMKQMGMFKRFKLQFKDLSHELSLKEMALPESQKAAEKRITNFIEHHKEIVEMGGPEGSALLLYGPPGTGKNTFSYAIAKKFPNAKFVEMDISKMNSKWHGESEQNVLGTMESVIKEANKNPDKKYFVFIDEIDSVMMQDVSSNAKLSQDILNAFKKGFNDLTNKENIVVIGATNLKINPELAKMEGKVLDSAMLDRFAEKVLVDLPTKDQIKLAITNYYKNPKRPRVDEALKDINNDKLDKIAEFLAKKEHETSFRKLVKGLLQPTATAKEVSADAKVTVEDLINTIKNNKENLNITDAEMQAFLNSLK